MESNGGGEDLTFKVLHARLLSLVNARIQNGEFSERGLAKLLGISQSQLHNVLKGARTLRTPLADLVLAQFQISIVDLLTGVEPSSRALKEDLRGSGQGIPRKQPESLGKWREQKLKAS